VNTEGDLGLEQVLVEFAHTLGTDFSIQKILDHLVLRIVDILPVTGAGVMLMGERHELRFVAASNEVVMAIEGLQNELNEGPCLEAYNSGEAVAITDLRVDTRFPRFSPRACADGLAAVFTFPLRLGANRLGALDLYRDSPGALSGQDLKKAQVLADVAAAYLFNAQARTDTVATLAELHHRALHDPLTGLPNRTLLEELLEKAVARARRSHLVAAVLFIDLDGFKSVNDRHGHHVGDQLLRAVAGRLTQALRPGDTLARLGGDEFVALCEDMHNSGHAQSLAERITTVMSTPFDLPGHQIAVTASVGIAFSGPGQDIPQTLLRDADFAMYQAKNNGGGRHQVIHPEARLAADRRDELEGDLKQAQHRAQLTLVYQPIIDIRGGGLVAVEALLRWQHPDRGTVMPDMIIPSAERTGLILSLGEWVLRRACHDLHRWQARGLAVPSVAVNVSAHQVMGPSFAHAVQRVLGETGADPAAVCLEVTETVFLTDAPRALAVLSEVKDLGVQLSLDDFGTGYSSLSYLRQFPVDVVKIDRSFTANVLTDRITRSIVGAMIDLSHVLDLTVTAEGVETPRELTEITHLGADQAQGFHLSRPLTPNQLAQYVTDGTGHRTPQKG
jgi:diguanylate cyclase (GGDEF)-like protein